LGYGCYHSVQNLFFLPPTENKTKRKKEKEKLYLSVVLYGYEAWSLFSIHPSQPRGRTKNKESFEISVVVEYF
jgi:hypothetical protein